MDVPAWDGCGYELRLPCGPIRLPDLAILVDEQRYTRLSDSKDSVQRFHYQSVRTGFGADLEIDAAGIVVSYPPYWRRIYA